MKKILIIEDDIHIGNALEEVLSGEGYEVWRAYSGTEALLVLEKKMPDLVLLDLMLPGLGGEEVLPKVTGIPVIILSARADVDSKVELLLGGAADYVTKPFVMKELLARIQVQLRLAEGSGRTRMLEYSGIRIDCKAHTVSVDGGELKLTRTEYAILKILVQNAPQIVAKSVLLDQLGGDTPDCTESSLKTHISHLRGKLLEAAGKDCIETVWGIGFRVKCP